MASDGNLSFTDHANYQMMKQQLKYYNAHFDPNFAK